MKQMKLSTVYVNVYLCAFLLLFILFCCSSKFSDSQILSSAPLSISLF